MSAPPEAFEVLVVGGGPAGLSAALWLGRYRRRTLVVDRGDHRNDATELAHGYLSRDPIDPGELLEIGRRQLAAYAEVVLRDTGVSRIRPAGSGFAADLDDGACVEVQRVVLATGVRDELPELAGFDRHYGADVFHCPSCDGYETRDRNVVTVGWDEQLAEFARHINTWARSVTAVLAGQEGPSEAERRRLAAAGIETVAAEPVELVGSRGNLREMVLGDGRRLPCEMAFFNLNNGQRSGLADSLGCEETEQGCVRVDDHGRTSITGVFAAGDMTPGPHLVQVAGAKGVVAGVACAHSLLEGVEPDIPPEQAHPLATERSLTEP
ncbi:MAG: NAD(P)/FAD-dependent oxidoreductase [Candidatus Dormibacteria bacterium]